MLSKTNTPPKSTAQINAEGHSAKSKAVQSCVARRISDGTWYGIPFARRTRDSARPTSNDAVSVPQRLWGRPLHALFTAQFALHTLFPSWSIIRGKGWFCAGFWRHRHVAFRDHRSSALLGSAYSTLNNNGFFVQVVRTDHARKPGCPLCAGLARHAA